MVRQTARSDHAARERYVGHLQRALSCISRTIWLASLSVLGDTWVLTTAEHPIRLRREGENPLFLSAAQDFLPLKNKSGSGEWRVRTLRYSYALTRTNDLGETSELVSWHWHPPVPQEPHVHVGGDLHKWHVPSGRVSFEAVMRFLLVDVEVIPEGGRTKEECLTLLKESEERFLDFRTWSSHPELG